MERNADQNGNPITPRYWYSDPFAPSANTPERLQFDAISGPENFWKISFYANDLKTLRVNASGADIKPVPEPATMLLLGTGLLGLAVIGRRKFKK